MISSLIVGSLGGSNLSIFVSLISKSSVALSGGSQTSEFSMFVHGVANPVDSGVISDGIVLGVNADDLEELVGSVFRDPEGVEDSQGRHSLTDSFFSNRSEGSLALELGNTLTGRLSVDDTLGHGSFSSSSSDLNSVDHVSLFGLVTESSGLVRSGRSGGSVDGGQLSVFPSSNTEDKSHHISLFLSPKFFQIFVSSHNILKYLLNSQYLPLYNLYSL